MDNSIEVTAAAREVADRIADLLASTYGAAIVHPPTDYPEWGRLACWVIEGDRLGEITCRFLIENDGTTLGYAWNPDNVDITGAL